MKFPRGDPFFVIIDKDSFILNSNQQGIHCLVGEESVFRPEKLQLKVQAIKVGKVKLGARHDFGNFSCHIFLKTHDLGVILQHRGYRASTEARILGQAKKLIKHKEDLVLLCVVNEMHVEINQFFLFPTILERDLQCTSALN